MALGKLFRRDYLLLWLGLSVSRMGDGAGFLAVMWWVQVETGSAVALGAVAMAQTIPGIVLSPLAGVVADRFNRKHIIVWMDVVRGVIYMGLAWGALTGTLTVPLLIMARALSSVASVFFGPAVGASVPKLVDRSLLERANSMNEVTGNLVFMLGTAFGGALTAFLGVPLMMLINAVSFLLSALSESFIHMPFTRSRDRVRLRTFLDDILTGWNYVSGQVMVMRVLKAAVVINFFFSPLFVLLPKFVAEDLLAGPEIYGYLLSSMTAGALAAMIVISTTGLVQRNLWIVIYGIMIQGLLFGCFVFAPPEYPAVHCVLFFLTGFFNATINVYFVTILQRVTDPAHLGKVFGLTGTLTGALQPLAQGMSGIAANLVALKWVYTVCAVAITWGGKMFSSIPGLYEFARSTESPAEVPAD